MFDDALNTVNDFAAGLEYARNCVQLFFDLAMNEVYLMLDNEYGYNQCDQDYEHDAHKYDGH